MVKLLSFVFNRRIRINFGWFVIFIFSCAQPHEAVINSQIIHEDLHQILDDLENNYVYFSEKQIDMECIRKTYLKKADGIESQEQAILLFENLLNEFHDSHLTLNTNVEASFRLYSPIYAAIKNGEPEIVNIWQSQLEEVPVNLLGAKILKFNQIDINYLIENFPSYCNDKNNPVVREWNVNKILAGRYNESRILGLQMANGEFMELDIDELKVKKESTLLNSDIIDEIGIIRINNSLGNNQLILDFDEVLDDFMNTKGLILDLRNTVDGGNTYVARAIMGRFIKGTDPYQIHWKKEQYNGFPSIERCWIEYVTPRKERYKNPVVVLVDRWTGSMGEGLAVGLEGLGVAEIVGTEMQKLAGEMSGFSFKNQSFGYRLSTAKLLHINGTPREKFVPVNYVNQDIVKKDQILELGLEIVGKMDHDLEPNSQWSKLN